MSASMRPTRRPWRASAAARFTETLDLPTPPLPEETASTLPRCGNSTGVGGGGTAAAPGGRAPAPRAGAPPPATVIFTPVTPATACTALRASRARGPGSSAESRKVNITCPRSSTARSWALPAGHESWATRKVQRQYDKTLPPETTDDDLERRDFFSEMKKREF